MRGRQNEAALGPALEEPSGMVHLRCEAQLEELPDEPRHGLTRHDDAVVINGLRRGCHIWYSKCIRSPRRRSVAAEKAARTKGPQVRKAAARKAAKTRRRRTSTS